MVQDIDDDELEEMMMQGPTPREKEVAHHDMMFKALSNPIRRKIIAAIGAFGKSFSQIQAEVGIEASLLTYNLDFLKEGEYAILDGDIYRLTDKGLGLLSNI